MKTVFIKFLCVLLGHKYLLKGESKNDGLYYECARCKDTKDYYF